MAKRVLGNDPFLRGAAQRPEQSSSTSEQPSRPAPKAADKKAAEKKAPEKKAAAKRASEKASERAPKKSAQKATHKAAPQKKAPTTRHAAEPRDELPPAAPMPGLSEEELQARARREQEVDAVLASAAALEAQEAAEEFALDSLLARPPAPEESLEERAAPTSVEPPSDTPEESLEEQSEAEELEDLAPAERAVVFAALGQEQEATQGMPPPSVNAEEELPDISRDEFPPGRQAPLSLVPPLSEDGAAPQPSGTSPLRDEPLPSRAAAMLSLARDIASQALASEALGQMAGAAGGMWKALRSGLGTAGSTTLDDYGKDAALVDELQPVLDFLYERYWRVSIQGASHLPRGPAILVANHSGALPFDGLVAFLSITRERPDLREPRWLVEDQIFHAPVLGTLFNRLGAVRACPDNALRLLDEQRPVVVFPEGFQGLSKPFAQRYQLKRFGRGGFVKLALRTGAPIVPVAIVGAEETSPLLGRIPASFLGVPYLPLMPLGPLPLPAKWSIRFGEPMSMEGRAPESANDLGEVQRLTERTRESIQGMLQALLRERRGVFAG